MSLLDKFSDSEISKKLLYSVSKYCNKVNIMEICGTHTVSIFRTGIRAALPKNIKLISGPGCPVCVTPNIVIEKAIEFASMKENILFCFGDMLRVPGITCSIEQARAGRQANVKLMYSPIEALSFAKNNPDKNIILFGVGFETTIPLFASVINMAKEQDLKNLKLFSEFKLVGPALQVLLASTELNIDGFLLPGNVSTIIGENAYRFMVEEFQSKAVIAGFEVVDILDGINELLKIIFEKKSIVLNRYSRFVTKDGNIKAKDLINKVFTTKDSEWRGLGSIPKSGLELSDEYKLFDAENMLSVKIPEYTEPKGCICGSVIKGICQPTDCSLFGKKCTPSDPVGPCMVSSEGTCAAFYKYGE